MASRYANIGLQLYRNKPLLGTVKILPPEFYQQFSPTIIKTTENDTLDQLAFDYYDGHGEYWWIIALANGFDLPTDMEPNMKLIIPEDYKSLISAINSLNKV